MRTIRNVDKIALLNKGMIEQIELRETSQLYRDMILKLMS